MDASAAVVIAATSLAVVVAQIIWGGSWGLSKKLSEMEKGLRKAIDESKREIESRQDSATHDIGETFTALRTKIHNLELETNKTFVRRDEFFKVNSQNIEALNRFGEKIEARLERMEAKIDRRG